MTFRLFIFSSSAIPLDSSFTTHYYIVSVEARRSSLIFPFTSAVSNLLVRYM